MTGFASKRQVAWDKFSDPWNGIGLWKEIESALAYQSQPAQEPVAKPLTDEQIWDVYMKEPVDIDCHVSDLHKFARAIEAAHGITAPSQENS